MKLINRKTSIVFLTLILSLKINHISVLTNCISDTKSEVRTFTLSPNNFCTAFIVRQKVSFLPIQSCEPVPLKLIRTVRQKVFKYTREENTNPIYIRFFLSPNAESSCEE